MRGAPGRLAASCDRRRTSGGTAAPACRPCPGFVLVVVTEDHLAVRTGGCAPPSGSPSARAAAWPAPCRARCGTCPAGADTAFGTSSSPFCWACAVPARPAVAGEGEERRCEASSRISSAARTSRDTDDKAGAVPRWRDSADRLRPTPAVQTSLARSSPADARSSRRPARRLGVSSAVRTASVLCVQRRRARAVLRPCTLSRRS